jgi:hypothetical protein
MMAHCKDSGYELTGPLVAAPPVDVVAGRVFRIYDPETDAGCRIIVSNKAEVFWQCEGRGGAKIDEALALELLACALAR